ncbi:MAG: GTP pyrophosphokinase [Paludibacteraceae bacterium]|nr:GTP pyrophosphokinase [Paludibacteraceae bacterium]
MSAAESILNDIESKLEANLIKSGLMFHIFSRVKSIDSLEKKMKEKEGSYRQNGKKMQDFLALRITLYFNDDVEIVHQYLKNQSNYIDESVDPAEVDRFHPKRLNIILRIPENKKEDMKVALSQTSYKNLIDDTYEVQIRTILSEGWHEVEHDLRYKCKEEWVEYDEESRLLNGIYATLESAEWSMSALFDRLSYSYYKNGNWNSMMRNKMRLRFRDKSFSEDVINFLNTNKEVAKSLFRANRDKVMRVMLENGFSFPLTYDTIAHVLNYIEVGDKDLLQLADGVLVEEMQSLFGPPKEKK